MAISLRIYENEWKYDWLLVCWSFGYLKFKYLIAHCWADISLNENVQNKGKINK